MAFDQVFQGVPGAFGPVAAPGTAQSPALGVDVVNKELYVSAGEGWEELGSGGGGGGNLSGTLTPGVYPIATATHTLGDGTIDFGVTSTSALTIKNSGIGGTLITDTSGSGITLQAKNGNNNITANNNGSGGMSFIDTGGGGVVFQAAGTGATIQFENAGNNGTQITDTGGGGISIDPTAAGSAVLSPGNIVLNSIVISGTIYSAAGTPLPTPTSAIIGARAFVSDATANVYGAAYTSGGAIKAPVYCDGTQWLMG